MTLFNPLTQLFKDPTGWDDPSLVTQSYNSTTRVVTTSGTGKLYWQGRLVRDLALGSLVSVAHAATVGTWYYYYNGSAFVWNAVNTPWTYDMAQIAMVRYDVVAANSFCVRECHSFMQWQVHQELHETIGCYASTVGTVGSIVLNSTVVANRRPAITTTATLRDEDLSTNLPTLAAASYTRLYNAAGTATFVKASGDIVYAIAGLLQYNNVTTGTWVPLTPNQYAAVYCLAIPTAGDVGSQAMRYVWVSPQTASATLATIQALTPASLNLGNLGSLAEYAYVYKIIVRNNATDTDWTVISVETLSGTKISQVSTSGALTSVTTDATLTGGGTASSPLGIANTAVTAGSYGAAGIPALSATVDAQGRLTALAARTLAIDDLNNVTSNLVGTGSTQVAAGNHLHAGVYQPLDATLTAVAGVTTAADTMIYFNGVDTALPTTVTAFGRSLLDDAAAANGRTTLGCPPTAHAASATTYGVSTAANYGHAKAAATVPVMDGTANAGTTTAIFAMSDHIHPSDTSRALATDLANYLPLATGGTVSGDITLNGTTLHVGSPAGSFTATADYKSTGIDAIAAGTTWQAQLEFFQESATTITNARINVNTTANMTWQSAHTRANKDLLLDTGISVKNTDDTVGLSFGKVASTFDAISITNSYGTVGIGQAGASYAYYETDAPTNYFNKPLSALNNIFIDDAPKTITAGTGYSVTNLAAFRGCDSTMILSGSITKSSTMAVGDTIGTIAVGGRPATTIYLLVPFSSTLVVTLSVTSAGVIAIAGLVAGTLTTSAAITAQFIRA